MIWLMARDEIMHSRLDFATEMKEYYQIAAVLVVDMCESCLKHLEQTKLITAETVNIFFFTPLRL